MADPGAALQDGQSTRVALTAELVAILDALPRFVGCDLIFPGRELKPMSGWSPRMVRARRVIGLGHWTAHDLGGRSVVG